MHYERWRKSHKPFHWFAEFYGIHKAGGFDIIIGNPPYVEYSKVKKENIRFVATRQKTVVISTPLSQSDRLKLIVKQGSFGFIVPISLVCTQRMKTQDYIQEQCHLAWFSNYAERPSKLFEGL